MTILFYSLVLSTFLTLVTLPLAAAPTCKDNFSIENTFLRPNIPGAANVDEKVAAQILREVLPEYREALKFLIDQIKMAHIGFFEFRKALEESAKHFVSENQTLVAQKKFVSYSYSRDTTRKSNVWTFELLKEKWRELGLPEDLETFFEISEMFAAIRNQDKRDVLVTDDASYSGSQLATILSELSKINVSNLTVHLVIPFMTSASRAVIDQFRENLKVKIYSSHKMVAFSSLVENAVKNGDLSRDAAEKLNELYYLGEKTLIYFDHKLPDFLSSVSNRDNVGNPVIREIVIPTAAGVKKFRLLKNKRFRY